MERRKNSAIMEKLKPLKIGASAVHLEIISEPYIIMTIRGYAPVVNVKVTDSSEQNYLFIGSRTLSVSLEPLVKANGGKFSGLKFKLRKESDDRMASYILESN